MIGGTTQEAGRTVKCDGCCFNGAVITASVITEPINQLGRKSGNQPFE